MFGEEGTEQKTQNQDKKQGTEGRYIHTVPHFLSFQVILTDYSNFSVFRSLNSMLPYATEQTFL